MNWKDSHVLVTGGASFIGSHLVDALVSLGATVRIVDDLSSGKYENIVKHVQQKSVEFIKADLCKPSVAKRVVNGIDYVFHLAAIHGGRGFVDTHQAPCTINIYMDNLLIQQAHAAGVNKFIFASSGCVYPNYLQKNPDEMLFLDEKLVGPPFDPDNTYGWAKLTTEITLRAYAHDYNMKSASCRYFTVYGERGIENHAVIAMIAKAFIRQNPYEIWGDGTQVRNWTHVSDIVAGTIRAAEVIDDGSAVNLGTTERVTVNDAAHLIFEHLNFHPKVVYRKNKPTGPYNRVCDNTLAKQLLGWQPKVKFSEGVVRTTDWYVSTKNEKFVRDHLSHILFERG